MEKKGFNLNNYLPSWLKFDSKSKQVKRGPHAHSDASYTYPIGGRFMFSISYDGEKNLGELGPPTNYIINHDLLRVRSWQSYHESEVTQTVVKRYGTWMIGPGLKLQSEPSEAVLKSEGITIDTQEFSELVEARFNTWKKSKSSDYSRMRNLNKLAKEAHKNALIGGDVLVVMRYDGAVNVQLIDGSLVQSPQYGSDTFPQKLENGNRIINGVEVDMTGRHIRYYVKNREKGTYEPIEAISAATGMTTSFMVYGLEYRLGATRGIPLIAVVIETLKKMERYKEAVLGSAEERAKIVYTIVHKSQSDGSNPLTQRMAKAQKIDDSDDLVETVDGKEMARTIAVSTNKQTFNLGIDQELKAVDSKNDLYFKDFFSINIDLICAALEMPPNIAMSKYDSNYSASRAAIKDWENTLTVGRQDFGDQFYQRIYDFWLYTEVVFKGKVQAPGYIEAATIQPNQIILDAYQNARFAGPPVPHIDPVKEVNAIRAALGPAGANMPLTTLEAATEALGNGDSTENVKQFLKEKSTTTELEPKIEPAGNLPMDEVVKRINMMHEMLKSISERVEMIES